MQTPASASPAMTHLPHVGHHEPMAERVLTARELNRAVLARQLLLERRGARLPQALERLGGIQAQYAPSMYVGLWSRLDGFERATLTRALERRSVVQATLMRLTIHLVSATSGPSRSPRARRAAARGCGLLATPTRAGRPPRRAGSGSRSHPARCIAGRSRRRSIWAEARSTASAAGWTWCGCRRRGRGSAGGPTYSRPPRSGLDPRTSRPRRRSTAPFAATWAASVRPPLATSRITSAWVRERWSPPFGGSSCGGSATRREASCSTCLGRRCPGAETPAPPRFLPTWDSTLLVHARRAAIVPEEYRPRIFNAKTPQSVATFTVDGAVAGTWRHEKGRIEISPFGRLDRSARAALEDEAQRLAAFHSGE